MRIIITIRERNYSNYSNSFQKKEKRRYDKITFS